MTTSNKDNTRLGTTEVAPGTPGLEPKVRVEWVEDSAVLEHLFLLNCLISKDPQLISESTGWSPQHLHAVGGKSKRGGVSGVNVKAGYWYVRSYDWQKAVVDPYAAQFKPLAKTFDAKGHIVKYISSKNSTGATYTLKVSPAEIDSAVAMTGVEFPDRDKITDANASALYWRWALLNPKVPVVVTEGVKKAAALIGLGYPAIALPGVNNIWSGESVKTLTKGLQLLRAEGKEVHLCFDADIIDKTPVKKALKKLGTELLKPLQGAKQSCQLYVWQWPIVCDQGEQKGIDDVLALHGRVRVDAIVGAATTFSEWCQGAADRTWFETTLESVVEGACDLFFAEIEGELYLYNAETGVYDYCPVAKRHIAKALTLVSDPLGNEQEGNFTNANKPQHVRDMLQHIRNVRVVDPANVDRANQWCTAEGVLRVKPVKIEGHWEMSVEVSPHEPYDGTNPDAPIFTEQVQWTYQPDATSEHLEDFLSFCPESFRGVLLDYLSCTLSVSTARQTIGRDFKAVILMGQGANGKDTLRSLLKTVFPGRTCNIDLQAIRNHATDQSKFGLNGMDENTAVNFSSENGAIDLSKGNDVLKALVTGDPVVMAEKRQRQRSVEVSAAQIFCTNKKMYMSSPQASILSRVAVIQLPYTFLTANESANMPEAKRNQLGSNLKLANPQYGDPAWVCENLVPAFFNMLLARFADVLNAGGINWAPCQEFLTDMLAGSNHLQGFFDLDALELTGNSDDFVSCANLYNLYQKYCVDVLERGELVSSGAGFKLRDALAGSPESKFDPLLCTSQAFGKSVTKLTGMKTTLKRANGKVARVYTGLALRQPVH